MIRLSRSRFQTAGSKVAVGVLLSLLLSGCVQEGRWLDAQLLSARELGPEWVAVSPGEMSRVDLDDACDGQKSLSPTLAYAPNPDVAPNFFVSSGAFRPCLEEDGWKTFAGVTVDEEYLLRAWHDRFDVLETLTEGSGLFVETLLVSPLEVDVPFDGVALEFFAELRSETDAEAPPVGYFAIVVQRVSEDLVLTVEVDAYRAPVEPEFAARIIELMGLRY